MKLPETQIQTEQVGEFENQMFGVGDLSVIFDILRNKMYSNKPRTVCREIMSNARDAHIEVGKADVPIAVKLPTALDRSFWIQDFGPGISPDRMSNVFIKYGNSTKRDGDTQIGGFGLGAKSPFAYIDNFAIVTISPDENDPTKNIRREYAAYIDDSQIGTLSLASTKTTTDSTGTKIILSIKPQDIQEFAMYVKETALHWDVKPIIYGNESFGWDEIEVQYEDEQHDKRWVVCKKWTYYAARDTGFNDPLVIIDGIPYPLNLTPLKLDAGYDSLLKNIISSPLRLFFKTGDLRVTANREDLDYKPEVVCTIVERIKLVESSIRDIVKKTLTKKIDECKSYIEACRKWLEIKSDYLFVDFSLRWKNEELVSEISADKKFADDTVIYNYNYGAKKPCQTRCIPVSNIYGHGRETIIVKNDAGTKRPHARRVATLRDQHPDKTIYIVTFMTDEAEEDFRENKHWGEFKPLKLSDYEKKVTPGKNGARARSTVAKIKLLKGVRWTDTEADIQEDEGVYVNLVRSTAFVEFMDDDGEVRQKEVSIDQIRMSAEYLGITSPIYGVFQRYIPKLGDGWIHLGDKIKDKLDELNSDPDVVKYAGVSPHLSSETWNRNASIFRSQTFQNNLNDSNGICMRILDLLSKIKEVESKGYKLRRLTAMLGMGQADSSKTESELTKLLGQFNESYPLLKMLSIGYRTNEEKAAKAIAEYINFKDESP